MSEASRAARAAMKSKAERLVRTDPKGTVDASGYTPPDALDADVKTGMRPISPRAFRKGGKVKGAEAHHHAGRKPRKAGGRALTPDSMINRNAKEANEERDGEKHIGALKRGGKAHRKHRDEGGSIDELLKRNPPPAEKAVPLPPPRPKFPHDTAPKENYRDPYDHGTHGAKRGGKVKKSGGGPLSGDFYGNVLRPNKQAKGGKVEHDDEAMDKALIKKMVKPSARIGKDDGGSTGPGNMMKYPNGMDSKVRAIGGSGQTPKNTIKPDGAASQSPGTAKTNAGIDGLKTSNPPPMSKADEMIDLKRGGRTGKAGGGRMPLKGHGYHAKTDAELRYIAKDAHEAAKAMRGMDSKAEGKYLDQVNDASTVLGYRSRGGQKIPASTKGDDNVMNRGGMAAKISGTRPTGGRTAKAKGGEMPRPTPEQEEQIRQEQLRGARVILGKDRTARAAGGRTKGKTNVNIIIGQHPPGATGGGGMPMPPAPKPSMPVPMPPPPPGGMQGPPGAPGAPGAPMPVPMPMGPQGGGMPPMGRARGGRTYPIHDGAGGGEGRLEKIAAYGLKPPKKG